jgi:hypothetical protein
VSLETISSSVSVRHMPMVDLLYSSKVAMAAATCKEQTSAHLRKRKRRPPRSPFYAVRSCGRIRRGGLSTDWRREAEGIHRIREGAHPPLTPHALTRHGDKKEIYRREEPKLGFLTNKG